MKNKISFPARRKADHPTFDKGSEDIYDTKGLAESGYTDMANDEDQQPVGQGAPPTTLEGPPLKETMPADISQRSAKILKKVSAELVTLGDKPLARRISALAEKIASEGLYSTGDLLLSGDEATDSELPGGNDPPKNEVGKDQSGKIEVWGTHPPTKDMLASRKSSPAKKSLVKKTPAKKSKVAKATPRKASAVVSPWNAIQKEFQRLSARYSLHGNKLEVNFSSIDPHIAELTASLTDSEGVTTPLGVVAFEIESEDGNRSATVNINDALVHNESRSGVRIPVAAAKKYASQWLSQISRVASQFVN